jgi:hypothetical protein
VSRAHSAVLREERLVLRVERPQPARVLPVAVRAPGGELVDDVEEVRGPRHVYLEAQRPEGEHVVLARDAEDRHEGRKSLEPEVHRVTSIA